MTDNDDMSLVERLDALETEIRRDKSKSDGMMDMLERVVNAVISHGDAELLQQVLTIIAKHPFRSTGVAASGDSRVH